MMKTHLLLTALLLLSGASLTMPCEAAPAAKGKAKAAAKSGSGKKSQKNAKKEAKSPKETKKAPVNEAKKSLTKDEALAELAERGINEENYQPYQRVTGLARNAARLGNLPILSLCITAMPELVKLREEDLHGETLLMRSCCNTSVWSYECTKLLLEAGSDVNAKDAKGNTTLMYALGAVYDFSRNASAAQMELLLRAGADINAGNNENMTPLMLASRGYDTVKQMKMLLKAGADVKAEDKAGNTALMHAAKCGNGASLKILMDAGADVKHKNHEGKTALILAAENGRVDVVKHLLAMGTAADEQEIRSALESARSANHDDSMPWAKHDACVQVLQNALDGKPTVIETPADKAAAELVKRWYIASPDDIRSEEMVGGVIAATANTGLLKLFLAAGANPNDAVIYKGQTFQHCLIEASASGEVESVKALLAAGADANAKQRGGFTALAMAAANGHAKCIEVLLKAGANDKGDCHHPLYEAAKMGHADCVAALLKGGILYDSALRSACDKGHIDCAELLLAAHPEQKDLDRALVAACKRDGYYQNEEFFGYKTPKQALALVNMLLKAGASPNFGDGSKHYSPALSELCESGSAGYTECLLRLIQAGADVNEGNSAGITPLMFACGFRRVQIELAKALLKAGADVKAKDKEGKTALMYAAQRGERGIDCMKLLIEAGADVNEKDNEGKTALSQAEDPVVKDFLKSQGAKEE